MHVASQNAGLVIPRKAEKHVISLARRLLLFRQGSPPVAEFLLDRLTGVVYLQG